MKTTRTMMSVAIAVATVASLTACGGGDSGTATAATAPGDSGSFTLLTQSSGDSEEPMDKTVDAFRKKYPNIEVKVEHVPIGGTYGDALRTRLRSGNAPEVFYATPGSGGLASVMPLADAGYAADLTGQTWATASVPDTAKDLYYKDGKLYAVPVDQVTIAQVYNRDTLAKIGISPPTTMAELLADCPKATAKGYRMLSVAGANSQNAGLLASALAANYVLSATPDWNAQRKAGKVTFAGSKEWQQTLQAIIDLNKAGCFIDGAAAADIPQAAPAFANGQAASFVMPTGSISAVKGINPAARIEAYPLPGASRDSTRIYVSPSDALVLSKSGATNAAAVRFLEYVAAGEGSQVYADSSGNLSLRDAKNMTEAVKTEPDLAGIAPLMADSTKVFPLIQLDWDKPGVYAGLGKGVQGLLTGQQTVQDVLTTMDQAWDK